MNLLLFVLPATLDSTQGRLQVATCCGIWSGPCHNCKDPVQRSLAVTCVVFQLHDLRLQRRASWEQLTELVQQKHQDEMSGDEKLLTAPHSLVDLRL